MLYWTLWWVSIRTSERRCKRYFTLHNKTQESDLHCRVFLNYVISASLIFSVKKKIAVVSIYLETLLNARSRCLVIIPTQNVLFFLKSNLHILNIDCSLNPTSFPHTTKILHNKCKLLMWLSDILSKEVLVYLVHPRWTQGSFLVRFRALFTLGQAGKQTGFSNSSSN